MRLVKAGIFLLVANALVHFLLFSLGIQVDIVFAVLIGILVGTCAAVLFSE